MHALRHVKSKMILHFCLYQKENRIETALQKSVIYIQVSWKMLKALSLSSKNEKTRSLGENWAGHILT